MRLLQRILPALTIVQVIGADDEQLQSPTREASSNDAAALLLGGDELTKTTSDNIATGGIRASRALRSDGNSTIGLRSSNNSIASYDEILGIPKCMELGASCDTGDLIIGRGKTEPNQPNTFLDSCRDGQDGDADGEAVNKIIISSETGGLMTEGSDIVITAYINCWAGGYTNDYVYFYYARAESSNGWQFIEKIQCQAGGQQIMQTTYSPSPGEHVVRVSIRYMEENYLEEDEGQNLTCGTGPFDDNDDVAFTVAAAPSTNTLFPTPAPTPSFHPTMTRETFSPTNSQTPSFHPSTPDPTYSPTEAYPTYAPTSSKVKTLSPTPKPTTKPTNTNPDGSNETGFLGFTLVENTEYKLMVNAGLTIKRIAKKNQKVQFENGESTEKWHLWMDGAAVIHFPEGGYAYVSNSEHDDGMGGVYGLYLNDDHEVTGYKKLMGKFHMTMPTL
jgi:hypothetical protein